MTHGFLYLEIIRDLRKVRQRVALVRFRSVSPSEYTRYRNADAIATKDSSKLSGLGCPQKYFGRDGEARRIARELPPPATDSHHPTLAATPRTTTLRASPRQHLRFK